MFEFFTLKRLVSTFYSFFQIRCGRFQKFNSLYSNLLSALCEKSHICVPIDFCFISGRVFAQKYYKFKYRKVLFFTPIVIGIILKIRCRFVRRSVRCSTVIGDQIWRQSERPSSRRVLKRNFILKVIQK